MEEGTPEKRTRPRTKSSVVEKAAGETAPNLNGSKDGGQDAVVENMDTTSTPITKPEEGIESEEKPSQGRKRKAEDSKEDEIEQKQVEEKPKTKGLSDAENSSDEIKELNHMSDDQTLGKGKRARIPNKRYSDLAVNALTPKADEKIKKSTENGELATKEDINTNTSSSPIIKVMKVSSPAHIKRNKTVNMCAPAYLKPFKCGWKRELVYRSTSDNPHKPMGDIYYYTPNGKKLRSMREISENIKNCDLTLENFTFFKEPLGVDDPEKEIIRDAKVKTPLTKVSTPTWTRTTKISSPKTTPVPATSTLTTTTTTTSEAPKNKSKRSTFKIKVPIKGKSPRVKSNINKKPKEAEKMDQTQWNDNKKSTKIGNNLNDVDHKPCRPCSIRCPGVSGLIPTLQCRLCLCLYHNECVGLASHLNIQGYVCKNCQLDQDTITDSSSAPPTSITSIDTLKSITNQSSILPQLQRIANLNNDSNKNSNPSPTLLTHSNITLSKLHRPTDLLFTSHQNENKSLVGSVTTWFPPSSTIQVGNNELNSENNSIRVPRPQFVEYIGNKKFLIVPKHNVLSVLPNSTFNKLEENVSTPDTVKDSTDITVPNIPQTPESAKMERNLNNVNSSSPQTQQMIVDDDDDNDTAISTATVEQEQEIPNKDDVMTPTERTERAATTQKSTNNTTVTETIKLQKLETIKVEAKAEINKFMDNYLQNLAYGYNTLLFVFQYLKVQDLLRAGCVCKMWRDAANHPILWKTVRMKNSQIHIFEGLADTLKRQGTINLDLRKMLLPAGGGDEIWPSFSDAIKRVESLRKIELCRCPASVVEKLAETNQNLEVINAITIKCDSMTLEPFKNLTNMKELRLKSTAGLSLTSDLDALTNLKQLTHLSLTSIRDLNKLKLEVIAQLENLESLDLGECTDFPDTFGNDILVKLKKLEKLRLEKGQETCNTFEILEAVKSMEKLEQLELVNFDIKTGFNKSLGACSNIKKLLIIPTYISQSATTNNMVLSGVLRLRNTLTHFVWGVTLELLRVTELFVDQCEEPENKSHKKKVAGTGDSIPVLKPVPCIEDIPKETELAVDAPQVEILPLPNLQKLLLQNLPTTRVKILKIPFHATWRQSITDTGN